jgi:hypothetical protein
MERQLRNRVLDLEQQIKIDIHTRNELLEKLAAEIAGKERAEDTFHKLEIEMLQLKAEHERLDRRLKALMSVGDPVYFFNE